MPNGNSSNSNKMGIGRMRIHVPGAFLTVLVRLSPAVVILFLFAAFSRGAYLKLKNVTAGNTVSLDGVRLGRLYPELVCYYKPLTISA